MIGVAGARAWLFGGLVEGIRPPPVMSVAEWFAQNIVLIDGPLAGQLWTPDGAPYLVEIANRLGDDDPCHTVTIRKSQQSGASILALAWMCWIADREPANTLYAVPGIDALKDLNSQKLDPLIKAFEKRRKKRVFAPQTSRSGTGSTTFEKKFGEREYLALGNANSKMDLSSKTCRRGVKDELSKWEKLQNGEDPETLFFGRFTAFRRRKNYKILEISTPEVDTGDETGETPGHCRIDRSFLGSDRRFWHIRCPECERLLVQDAERFRIDYAHPHRSKYECRCGHMISESERVVGVRGGQWVPMIEEAGRQPGYHIDAFISLMMSYEAIAEDAIKAEKGSEKDRKDYSNLTLGRAYKFRGDAPDYKLLMERREDGLRRGHVPARGLLLCAAADVQMRGVWLEITAYAPDGQSWLVDAMYIDGDTDAPGNDVFRELRRQTLDRQFPDAFGRTRSIDALAIDSGYRAHVVYSWVRLNQARNEFTRKDMIYATKGVEGWRAPAISTPSLVDIDLGGKRIPQGAKVWSIGTWSLKSSFYTQLHKPGIRSGEATDPAGYCHFGMWVDAGYFKQITAEHLRDKIEKGRVIGREWAKTTENHFLDCRIYNNALAEFLGLGTMTADEWAVAARRRGMPDAAIEVDLFSPRAVDSSPAPAAPGEEPAPSPATPAPLPPSRSANPFAAIADLNAW